MKWQPIGAVRGSTCPWCGGKVGVLCREDGEYTRVGCHGSPSNCGLAGPACKTEEEALAAWSSMRIGSEQDQDTPDSPPDHVEEETSAPRAAAHLHPTALHEDAFDRGFKSAWDFAMQGRCGG